SEITNNGPETINENVANFEKVDSSFYILDNLKNDLKLSVDIELEILYLNTTRKVIAELWEEITKLNIQ
ncbi:3439_t:CDS:2, partial [Racocetra persica]